MDGPKGSGGGASGAPAAAPAVGHHHQPSNGHGPAKDANGKGEHSGKGGAVTGATAKGGGGAPLSHVPCKFYKQGACTAGSSCPFSHELSTPGASKPVCQWFASGKSCKFGHKCALAHILPGQPMSFDRKNKRAAQAAQRGGGGGGGTGSGGGEHQAPTPREAAPVLQSQQAEQPVVPPAAAAPVASTSATRPAGPMGAWGRPRDEVIGIISGAGAGAAAAARPALPPAAAASTQQQQHGEDLPFGLPDVEEDHLHPQGGVRHPQPLPPLQHQQAQPIVPFFAAGAAPHHHPPPQQQQQHHQPKSPSRLSQSLKQQALLDPRSSVAAQLMALSSSSSSSSHHHPRSESLSPSRYAAAVAGNSPNRTSPLSALNHPSGANGTAAFGTSPFSSALFMPSSWDSNEGHGFGRSPPVATGFGFGQGQQQQGRGRSQGRGGEGLPMGVRKPVMAETSEEEEEPLGQANGEEEDDGFADEGLLPSSLNDLLTPSELARRRARAARQQQPGMLDPFAFKRADAWASQSVPKELTLSSGEIKARFEAQTNGSNGRHGLDEDEEDQAASREREREDEDRLKPRSLLSVGKTFASLSPPGEGLLPSTANIYSSSFDPSAAGYALRSPPPPASSLLHGNGHGPAGGLAPFDNTLHQPSMMMMGSSLPGGLAAGLSRLHLQPAVHTGETPPNSFMPSPPAFGLNDLTAAASPGRHSYMQQASSPLSLGGYPLFGSPSRAMAMGGGGWAQAAPPEFSATAPEFAPRPQLQQVVQQPSSTGLHQQQQHHQSGLRHEFDDDIQFDLEDA